jgi:hypothetical protein
VTTILDTPTAIETDQQRHDQRRAQFSASLRDLADTVDASPWLPIPLGRTLLVATVAYGAHGHIAQTPARFAALRQIAERLNLDVVEDAKGDRETTATFGVIHYHLLAHRSEAQPGGNRIVPADEDQPPAT